MSRLTRRFFNRNTITVAKELLGKYLVRRINGKVIAAKITETEAYCGQKDLACHASKGLTERTKVMFGPPGCAYVYLVYGMYHCFNVVTREEGCPEAVLVRAAEITNPKTQIPNKFQISNTKIPTNGSKKQPRFKNLKIGESELIWSLEFGAWNFKLDGPGKLCRALKIDKRLNGIDLCKSKELWIEDRRKKLPRIKRGKRTGVDYAGEWKDKLWRFYV